MPPALHRHLKRGLDLGCRCHSEPDAAMEAVPREQCHGQDYEAKRRRIETIAADYLRGRPPLLLSAGLRGPFNNGWKNPWASTRACRRSSTQSSAAVTTSSPVRTRYAPKVKTKTRTTGRARLILHKKSRQEHSRLPASPEASRAPSLGSSFCDHDGSLSEPEIEAEMPPPTASSPAQHHVSGAMAFLHDDNETAAPSPFWLRRPQSGRKGGIHGSPTPNLPRSKRAAIADDGKLHGTPTTPIHQHGRSSASVSRMTSSPTYHHRRAVAVAADQAATPNTLNSTNIPTASPSPHSPDNGCTNPSTQSRVICKSLATMPAQDPIAQRHNSVASPAPASSISFKYRKRLDPKSKNRETHKPKARAMNFNSSPAMKKTASASNKHNGPDRPAIAKTSPPAPEVPERHCAHLDLAPPIGNEARNLSDAIRNDAEDTRGQALSEETMTEEQHLQHDSDRSAQPSNMSTQAAMLLAQLEFQESTYRTLSPPDAREWSPSWKKSPRPLVHPTSPDTTPFSVYNNRFDGALPNGSVPPGAPISTQDLFGAASPFAFSTIKKKAMAPPTSGLRFGLAVCGGFDAKADTATTKSPTPSTDRIPLKPKGNTTPSLAGFVSERCSQASRESLAGRSKCVKDVELPQLDLDTSWDELEAQDRFLVTDDFLRNHDASFMEPT